MVLREGAQASYVGYDLAAVGDRCLILSSERNYSHIKWVTGSKAGSYDRVDNDDLVADRKPARFEDEFTFETFSNRIVNTACKEVLEKRGQAALLRSVEQEGHLADFRQSVATMVANLSSLLRSDAAWSEIVDDLSHEDAVDFEKFAVQRVVEQALDEVMRDGSV